MFSNTHRLLIRVLPPSEDSNLQPLGEKFGCHEDDVPKLFDEAKTLALNIVGIRYNARNNHLTIPIVVNLFIECGNKLAAFQHV